jgi:transcriptional pleiotropic regulator of transition state genes
LLKSTGIVRRVDEVGRFVLPVELRQVYGIDPRTQLEIFTDGEQIVLRKYQPLCIFCGHSGEVMAFHGKTICFTCQARLSQAGT